MNKDKYKIELSKEATSMTKKSVYKKYIIYEEKDLNCNSKIKKESNKLK